MHEIAGYRVLRRLGEGGMGSVFLAEAPEGQQVAVKVIRPELLQSEEFRERFRREVDRAKTVPPFCTAEVIAADPDHDPPYLVIEYVDGPTLYQVVQESGPLRGAKLHSLAVGVATALTAIHGAGVIHRDLKPGNVLFSSGSIKVIDFGIARGIDSDTGNLTTANQVIGTIPYTSPERLGGAKNLTPAADIFAWGGVITFAATGRTPFQGDTPADTAISILSDAPDLDGLTGPLRDLVERALAKDPAARPTARELFDLLLNSAPTKAQPPAEANTTAETGPTMRVAVPSRKRRLALVAGVCSLLLVAAVGWTVGNSFWTGPAGADPSLSASPSRSPSPSLSPVPSPSPSPSGPVESDPIPPGLLLVIRDGLTPGGDWTATEDRARGKCEVGPDGLTVSIPPRSEVYRCNGRFDQTTDFAAFVDVKTAGISCAAIWFRYQLRGSDAPGIQQPDGGYALQVCQDRAYFISHSTAVYRTHHTMNLRRSPAEAKTRIGIVATGHSFTFYQDGEWLSTWEDNTFRIGRVALGLFQRNEHPPAGYQAQFSDLLVYGTSLLR